MIENNEDGMKRSSSGAGTTPTTVITMANGHHAINVDQHHSSPCNAINERTTSAAVVSPEWSCGRSIAEPRRMTPTPVSVDDTIFRSTSRAG
mmetsp:Transcript_4490/g.10139  ORF Transcript_4490/g.10139 Transcript_4490/m.10139 type:complete len:92 (-) Transcript_4490:4-279(-)